MDYYLSQVMLWALDWAPRGWTICDGKSLPVRNYQALYALLGNYYGGDSVNFNIPDLRGRVPVGFGRGAGLVNNYLYAKPSGNENTTLGIANMPAHTHTGQVSLTGSGGFVVSTDNASFATPSSSMVLGAATTNAVDVLGNPAELNIYTDASDLTTLPNALTLNVTGGGSFTTNATGGNQAFSNIQPVLAMNYIMLIEGGIFPPRP